MRGYFLSWSKKVSVSYHFIEAADEEYFVNFLNSMNALLDSGETFGSFEAGETRFVWKINGREDISDTDTYFISLVKEKTAWPVWFNEEGEIASIPLSEGFLGELFYAYVNPARKFLLAMAATSGAAAGSFKKFLNEFSTDGGVKLIPLFEDKIDVKTLSWDYYKKVSVSMTFPTHDDLTDFNMTQEGKLLGIVDELGGLKFDVTVAAPKQKQVLNAAQIRDMLKNLLGNDFCGRLVVRGADFETEALEEYDIKNAQVKYTEEVEISGSYMSEDEARGVLRRAFAERAKDLLRF